MALSKLESHLMFDKRLTERLVQDRMLERTDLAKHLKQLPDLAKDADEMPAYVEPTAASDEEPTFSAIEQRS